jgi:hypothetical protein
MNTQPDGVSAMSAELEQVRLRAALARIANMPGHCGNNMRQLAGDALGWPSVGQRDCHACLNGHGNHSTSCPEHPTKPDQRRYEFDGDTWTRSNTADEPRRSAASDSI